MSDTPKELADREMRRLASKAEDMLTTAARGITDDHIYSATAKARELFDSAPWLAQSDSPIGGCLHLRYCDLFALWTCQRSRAKNYHSLDCYDLSRPPADVWRDRCVDVAAAERALAFAKERRDEAARRMDAAHTASSAEQK